ncbi:MAG: DUF4215 domain-containing protein [Deltaproteobacteria bacterium]|nr:DUF4215 domain-containing protein [Deltaproteobacteria bacterium]
MMCDHDSFPKRAAVRRFVPAWWLAALAAVVWPAVVVPGSAAAAACGNGIVETGEECDDGNLDDSDTCLSDCSVNPACGTLTGTWRESRMGSTVELFEEPGGLLHGAGGIDIFGSDGSMLMVGDGTRSGTAVNWLGHGATWSACDWLLFPQWFWNGGLALIRVSRSACGDGVLDSGEACDDGNAHNADGCNFYIFAPPEAAPYCGPGMSAEFCVTVPAGCGNGVVDPGEACDDGDASACDQCTPQCTPACGDGIVGPGEECDTGGLSPSCYADCTWRGCGDAVTDSEAGEQCDDGNTVSCDGCSSSCGDEIGWVCGDGIADPACGESCDGNDHSGCDGLCDANCACAPFCGNGRVEAGEECDDGNTDHADTCTGDCTVNPDCGGLTGTWTVDADGSVVQIDEAAGGAFTSAGGVYDRGDPLHRATYVGSGLRQVTSVTWFGTAGVWPRCDALVFPNYRGLGSELALTRVTRGICGDGVLDAGEACDDGNTAAADGCRPYSFLPDPTCAAAMPVRFCTQATIGCGDAARTGDEACDGGDPYGCDACYPDCTLACGNDIVDPGEACDGPSATCDPDCTAALCGDGVVNALAGESCDDGATAPCDGCSPACQSERATVCGDGIVDAGCGEQCEDGNSDDGDCCSASCRLDPPGAVCPDTNACNGIETCDGSGHCLPGTAPDCIDTDPCTQDYCDDIAGCQFAPNPLPVCNEAPEQRLVIRRDDADLPSGRITWTWTRGAESSLDELGDPAADTWYALCVYDSSHGIWDERLVTFVGADPNLWKDRGVRGVLYRDPVGHSRGVRTLRLVPGPVAKPRLTLKIGGPRSVLPTPTPASGEFYFDQSPAVIVQLVNAEGACWGGEFTDSRENSGLRFEATIRAPAP